MNPDVLTDHPHLGRAIHDLPTPTALVDLDVLDANITTMGTFFHGRAATLRPHAKTHRTPAVARLQIAAGARGITCAKVGMAEAMVDGGIKDVYVANQVVAREAIARLCALARRARVAVAVDQAANVAALSDAARLAGVTLDVLIEVEAGMGRCGVQPGTPTVALAIAIERAPSLRFGGLHAYEGHVVQHADSAIRKAETERMLARTLETRDQILAAGLPVPVVTCGGTGTYAISGVYPGVTEHQAGSYVYMDPGYQSKIPEFGLAFSVLCTVISRPTRETVITDGGLQVLANDSGRPAVKGYPDLDCRYLSEEHGTFTSRDGGDAPAIADVVEIYPGHCCSAANLHDLVYGARNGVVETIWRVAARGKSR
ncbi:MAG TPA: DSD1 family PLP-dependent enzyme [Chloroflexota bacterium]|nr:DSD1 family PLP-dependent enzyme [Chloroflexota bacterium]